MQCRGNATTPSRVDKRAAACPARGQVDCVPTDNVRCHLVHATPAVAAEPFKRSETGLDRPKLLVPAAADDPARVRMGGGVCLQSLLQIVERVRPDEVELKCAETETEHVPVRIDQPGQQRPAVSIAVC